MAFIAPFRGLRYNLNKINRMEDVVTPPYDVIDEKGQNELLTKNPHNMIHLDLTKNFTKETITEERYSGAKNLFERWQDEDILTRDEKPSFYIYNINYTHPSGRRLNRKGMVALVRLAEFSEGIVKPHEKTFRDVTTDRLRLLDTCKAQFSQIFSFYSDPKNEIMQILEGACSQEPLCEANDAHGNTHTLWQVYDENAIAQAQKLFQEKSVYIADGHHRYTTALQMRELVQERNGKVPETSPYNHTMMYLCCMEDPGLSVLPTHRLLHWQGAVSLDALQEKLAGSFHVQEVKDASREVLVGEALSRMEDGRSNAIMIGLYHPGEDRCLLLALKNGVMDTVFGAGGGEADLPQPLRELDVVVLSDLILDHLFKSCRNHCEHHQFIEYFSDPAEALDVGVKKAASSDDTTPLLFLLNPTLVAQVERIADAGLVMPHKSTYFYPKILTGMVINKLVPGEVVGK